MRGSGTTRMKIETNNFKTQQRFSKSKNLKPNRYDSTLKIIPITISSASMDFTPPSKPASRLAIEAEETPHFTVQAISPPPNKTPSPSPLRKSRSRLLDRFETNDEVTEPATARGRRKARGPHMGLLGCASPRSVRKSKKRSEVEIREDKDLCLAEEKARKRRSKKDKPITSTPHKLDNDENGSLDRIGQLITGLIMWKDAAKSSLWFGFGSLFFLSSCFAKAVSFRNNVEKKHDDFKLKEDDILRFAKLILPAANFAISKIRELFCGEAEMTLKVAPFFILGAEYGHLITLRRLCAIGFFTSFSVPKLYSCNQIQINSKVDVVKQWLFEAWEACSHKKVVVGSAATLFWNFSSLRTRIFTGFIGLVIVRYCRQFIVLEPEVVEAQEDENQALIRVEGKEDKEDKEEQKLALVVVEAHGQP